MCIVVLVIVPVMIMAVMIIVLLVMIMGVIVMAVPVIVRIALMVVVVAVVMVEDVAAVGLAIDGESQAMTGIFAVDGSRQGRVVGNKSRRLAFGIVLIGVGGQAKLLRCSGDCRIYRYCFCCDGYLFRLAAPSST